MPSNDAIAAIIDEVNALKRRVGHLERLEKSSYEAHDPVTLDNDASQVLDLTGQEIGLDVQAHNFVWAGPESGASDEPTFRPLVAADMPAGLRFVPLATAATSSSWDGDAKGTGDRGIIDLSAVFGLPAGITAIAVCLGVKDATVGAEGCLGPSGASSATRNAVVATVQVANQYIHTSGIVPCDGNGDVYFYNSEALDAVYIRIYGYWL